MSLVVDSIQIIVISHATENDDKIVRALATIFSLDSSRLRIEKRTVKGHFGNPITTILSIARGKRADGLLDEIYRMLPSKDQTRLLEELGSRIDEDGRLHLRFDKQDCFRGIVRLEDDDPVKVTVSLKGPRVSPESAVRFFATRLEKVSMCLSNIAIDDNRL